ncbi:DNA-directed RNA polymerase I subunit rpa49 [Ascosphaera aggregata]|nr:DNA-directed RNA polymerase I subunit rpa49 [Ascosphaera aggregata]
MGKEHVEKKRKSSSAHKAEKSSKRPSLQSIAPLNVQFIHNENGFTPVIASTPGIDLPNSVSLTAYSSPREVNKSVIAQTNSSIRSSELLLQSSTHPQFDFLGRESQTGPEALWNHYAAVYDSERGTLRIVQARNMVIRGSLRQRTKVNAESDVESDFEPATIREQRNALTEAFGTKQALRSVRSLAENALLYNAEGSPNAVESALLSTMPNDSASKAQQKQAEIQAAKPLPTPNMAATAPADVYSIESLVPNGLATLRNMPVSEWEEAVENGAAVTTTSRFVAHRVENCVNYGNKTTLQVLRFILLLMEFAKCLKPARGGGAAAGPGSKKLPPREDLRKILTAGTGDGVAKSSEYIPESVLDALRRRFVPQGTIMAKTDITLLHTTICALSLHIPPTAKGFPNASELSTDPADLRDDLRLDASVTQQYFRELGCRVDKPRETEYALWGVKTKAEGNARRIARLRIPVEFPKLSRGGGGGGGGGRR